MYKKPSFSKDELIFGRNPIIEAIKTNRPIDKILVADSLRGEIEKEIRSLCKEYEIPLSKLPLIKLNQMTNGGNHQGIAAFISPVSFQSLEDVLQHCFANGRNPLIIVLEGVSDVRNLAAIARSAHVFGADAVVITAKKSAAINGDTVKISAGAILKIPICREKNMIAIVDILRNNGITIAATSLNNAIDLDECDFNAPLAIVMGAEGEGITYETSKMVDMQIKIPQESDFDSLNVSVAAGIVLYEANRQRSKQ